MTEVVRTVNCALSVALLALTFAFGCSPKTEDSRIVQRFSNGTAAFLQEPERTEKVGDNLELVDFGKAAFGWLEIRAEEISASPVEITVRLGEKKKDGRVDMKPGGTIRSAQVKMFPSCEWTRVPLVADQRNTTGVNGKAIAIKLPSAVGVIMPFRYVEVPSGVKCRRLAVTWPMKQKVSFDSDNEDLVRLFDFCTYSIRATGYAGLMVDGDRERIPYEGDLYINMLGQLYGVDGEPELARRTIRHLLKYPTWPTEWQQHLIMCVWEDWHFTGSTALAAEAYEILKNQKLMIGRAREDGLLPYAGEADIVDWPPCYRDGYVMDTKANAVVNAFHYRNLLEMSDLAKALGKDDDAEFFSKRAQMVSQSFNATFFDPVRQLYVDGDGTDHVSLHANVVALDFGLVGSSEVQKRIADFIEKKGMACSPYFSQYLLEALFRYGKREAAMKLLTSTGPRSWLGMLEQGSTITMEAWNLKEKLNQDWNHAWGAVPANIIPRFVMGVRECDHNALEDGKLVVGYDEKRFPTGFAEPKLAADRELLEEICAKRGWKLVPMAVDADEVRDSLEQNEIDCYWPGLSSGRKAVFIGAAKMLQDQFEDALRELEDDGTVKIITEKHLSAETHLR